MTSHDTHEKPLTEFQKKVLEKIRKFPRQTTYDYGLLMNDDDHTKDPQEVYEAIGVLIAYQHVKVDGINSAITARES